MRLLLDTCAFLWLVTRSSELSSEAIRLFQSPENEVYLSSVSTWEIGVKYALGRLPLPDPPSVYIPKVREEHGVRALPLGEESTLYVSHLPDYHRDPFDRMLVCQAIVQNLVILTPDPELRCYPVRTRW